MKIKLRKVDYSASLIDETSAFSAEMWIDGKKEEWLQNHGTRGLTNVQLDTLRVRLGEHGKTLPKVDIGTPTGSELIFIVKNTEWIADSLLSH